MIFDQADIALEGCHLRPVFLVWATGLDEVNTARCHYGQQSNINQPPSATRKRISTLFITSLTMGRCLLKSQMIPTPAE
jgi:hypothetical protein